MGKSSSSSKDKKSSSKKSNNNKSKSNKSKSNHVSKIKRDQGFLRTIPRDQNRCPYVSEEAYARHIKMNEMRVSNDLQSNERVVDCDEDLARETTAKKLQYMRMISHEIYRYLFKNHIEKATNQRNSMRQVINENNEESEETFEVMNECKSDGDATVRSEELAMDSQKQRQWDEFVANGFTKDQKLEAFDSKSKNWYEAKIVELWQDGKSTTASTPDASTVELKIHYFNFHPKYDTNYVINQFSDLTGEVLKSLRTLAPKCMYTNGSRFPVPQVKKKKTYFDVEYVTVEPHEVAREWERVGDVDLKNIVTGSRKRRCVDQSNVYVHDDIERFSQEVCALCGEQYFDRDLSSPHQLYLCEGVCHRVFHAPCLSVPTPESNMPFYCTECSSGKHDCFSCFERGDNVENRGDTFPCASRGCGKFFHMSCIEEDPRARFLEPRRKKSKASSQSDPDPPPSDEPKQFYCARHTCIKCSEESDMEHARAGRVKACIGCANSFHDKCIPYGTIRNDVGFLCNVCARSFELPLSIVASTTFLDQPNARQNNDMKIDFTRYFQQQALELNVDANSTMRLPTDFIVVKASKNDKKHQTRPKFTEIKKNIYTGGTKPMVCAEAVETCCSCRDICGENCENRLLRIECINSSSSKEKTPKLLANCRARQCGNTAIQNMDYKKTVPMATPGRGWGLFADETIAEGDLVIEYVGEIITPAESRRRIAKVMESKGERHVFQMDLGDDQIIDARLKGNLARFVNHSCDPNCELHKWNVCGVTAVGIFARRPISKGEELTFDYSFQSSDEMDFVCLCGSSKCRGTLDAITTKFTVAKRCFEEIKQKIANFERRVREKRGGLLSKQFLRKIAKSEGEDCLVKWAEKKLNQSRKVAMKAQRANTPKIILQDAYKGLLSREGYHAYFPYKNRPFLYRNLVTGADLFERLNVRTGYRYVLNPVVGNVNR